MLYNIVKGMKELTKKEVKRSALAVLVFLGIMFLYCLATLLSKYLMSLEDCYFKEYWPLPIFYIGMSYHWFISKYMTGRYIRDGK